MNFHPKQHFSFCPLRAGLLVPKPDVIFQLKRGEEPRKLDIQEDEECKVPGSTFLGSVNWAVGTSLDSSLETTPWASHRPVETVTAILGLCLENSGPESHMTFLSPLSGLCSNALSSQSGLP